MTPHIYPEGCVFNSLDDIKGKKITVMGLGLNGGGEACVRFFLKHGAFVTVTDKKTKEQLAPTIKSLSEDKELDLSKLTYVLGEHRIQDFSEADCVIKNPGVKIEGNEYLAAAKAIETDLSIFLHFTKAPIIAVTGSKGKSSTVSAIDYGLKQAGFTSFLGGNITVSPLTFLEKTNETTPVVLELSSWQLADLRGRKALKPKISIITKIVPDHQNWYGDMDSYVADKQLIYAEQTSEDYTILDADEDDYLTETASPKEGIKCWGDLFASETKAKILRYSKKSLAPGVEGVYQRSITADTEGYLHLNDTDADVKIMGSLFVPGEHNKINVLNAALVLKLMNVETTRIEAIASSWKGIPHRLEFFHEWNGFRKVYFYNDTCATVPEAAAAATQSFGRPVVLISGGTDKGLDLTPLASTIAGFGGTEFIPYETYFLSGTGTEKITPFLDKNKISYEGPFDSLEVLLNILKSNLQKGLPLETYGDPSSPVPVVVVFSPGATSFGMFTNEFDRGDKFKKYVKELF